VAVIPSAVEESALPVVDVVARMTDIIGGRNEARDLISLVFDQPRHWPTVNAEQMLSAEEVDAAIRAAHKLAAGGPLQYAAGKAVFRHLTLHVDERVLIPRPETEMLVDLVLAATAGTPGGTVVDVCTGSGAIALALATEGTFDHVIATDISLDALDVAAGNAERYGVTLDLRQGSALRPVTERGLRAVVANPPYIAFDEAESLPSLVRDWEPSVALFASDSGNAVTAAIIRDAAAVLAPGGVLALEVDVRRAVTIAELAASHGEYENVQVKLDLTGRERFVVANRRGTGR
jgi:release factor glutamine methyltransferase